jgi:hypothetical protein
VHDQSELERQGIPAAMVATVEFDDAVEAQARACGFTPSAVFVDHPLQDRTDEEVIAMADEAFEEIVGRLVESD